jgi:hypothetical protein
MKRFLFVWDIIKSIGLFFATVFSGILCLLFGIVALISGLIVLAISIGALVFAGALIYEFITTYINDYSTRDILQCVLFSATQIIVSIFLSLIVSAIVLAIDYILLSIFYLASAIVGGSVAACVYSFDYFREFVDDAFDDYNYYYKNAYDESSTGKYAEASTENDDTTRQSDSYRYSYSKANDTNESGSYRYSYSKTNNTSESSSYRYSYSKAKNTSSSDQGNQNTNNNHSSGNSRRGNDLDTAIQFFGLSSSDLTAEILRRKRNELIKKYHTDSNSPFASAEKAAKINYYYSVLKRSLVA